MRANFSPAYFLLLSWRLYWVHCIRNFESHVNSHNSHKCPGRHYIRPPPPPPNFGQKAFLRERGGGCIFRTLRSRNFIRPPSFLHPAPLEGYFQGWGWGCVKFDPLKTAEIAAKHPTCHWEIKGRFRKRVVLSNVPSFRFSFRGNIRRNHPFGNHPFVNTKKAHWEIKGQFRKRVVLVNVPLFRFSFRGEHPPRPPFWKPPELVMVCSERPR